MKRRSIVYLSGAAMLGVALPAFAQPAAGKVWRIGVLSGSIPVDSMRTWFGQFTTEFGYVEGRNLVIDVKFANSKSELLPRLAEDLLANKPDLLIGLFNREIIALKRATSTVPIIMMYATVPVELGLVSSLANPGGNITGTVVNAPPIVGKTFQILRETIPTMTRLARLYEADFPGASYYDQHVDEAARLLGLRLNKLAIGTASDIDLALNSLERDRPDAISVSISGPLLQHIGKVVDFATRQKLPAHFGERNAVVKGGLMCYTPDVRAMARRNVWMIDKIFKGATPSGIPVEEPTVFQFTINMKTAKALSLVIPPTVLLQATDLIE